MRTRSLNGLTISLLVLLLLPLSADAVSLRKQCRRECNDEINACVASGQRRRACKKQLIRRCKFEGLSVCLPPIIVPTTTSTTTTATLPPTTSTTLPCDLSGTWFHNCSGTQQMVQSGDQVTASYYDQGVLQSTGMGTLSGRHLVVNYDAGNFLCPWVAVSDFDSACDQGTGTWQWLGSCANGPHPWILDRNSPPGGPCQ